MFISGWGEIETDRQTETVRERASEQETEREICLATTRYVLLFWFQAIDADDSFRAR